MSKTKKILGFTATVVTALCFIYAVAVLVTQQAETAPKTTATTLQKAEGSTDKSPALDLEKIFQLVNSERVTAGLAPLVHDELLNRSAQEKCDDMVARDYWQHSPPNGGTTWDSLRKYNAYTIAGENLAEGFKNESELVQGWMNSEGHKKNILMPGFTNIGYAQCEYPPSSKNGEATIVVQHFADNPTGL